MNHDEQLIVEFPDDALAQSAQADDAALRRVAGANLPIAPERGW
jgi:hypothetical protein